jgi:hypothetical protein
VDGSAASLQAAVFGPWRTAPTPRHKWIRGRRFCCRSPSTLDGAANRCAGISSHERREEQQQEGQRASPARRGHRIWQLHTPCQISGMGGSQTAPEDKAGKPGTMWPCQTEATGREEKNEQGRLVGDVGGRTVDCHQGQNRACEACGVRTVVDHELTKNERSATEQPSTALIVWQRPKFCEEGFAVFGTRGREKSYRPAEGCLRRSPQSGLASTGDSPTAARPSHELGG